MEQSVSIVYENQRFYGLLFGWYGITGVRAARDIVDNAHIHRQSPALLERPPWSDASGQPVTLTDPPNDTSHTHSSKGWIVHISPATDADGWQYASVFKYAHTNLNNFK